MCGITGIFAFNMVGGFNMINIVKATEALANRGPEVQDIYHNERVGMGHRRLSIIDVSAEANQPMWDATGRYCIVFNGEIYNYKTLRAPLEKLGVTFRTQSDTEVLLYAYIHYGEDFLQQLNGFFTFSIYDKEKETMFLARDRFGIKPLLYYVDEDKFIFASEMKSLLAYGIEKKLNYEALYTFLQLNYIPAPTTIFQGVHKLMPGHSIFIDSGKVTTNKYYELPRNGVEVPDSYAKRKAKLVNLMTESVERRMVADVPLGSFLSGGVDSSVVATLAARQNPDLHTFSIGFADEPFFDETKYAHAVAKKIGTDHTVFSLTNKDLYKHLDNILAYIDEPFADSSAIAVYTLSHETRKHATVALSGDGADEMLAGYNKHAAFNRMINPGVAEHAVSALQPLWSALPKSRSSKLTNAFRQLHRFSKGMRLSAAERYWLWAGFATEDEALQLMSTTSREQLQQAKYKQLKEDWLAPIGNGKSITDVLNQDMHFVLPNDMLTKVDLMSMANSLEVRVPFLDHQLVEYLFSLPDGDKINGKMRKRILQDAFSDVLPAEIYNRPKKGFEVPLLQWFRGELKSRIMDDLLSDSFVEEQGVFDIAAIRKIKKRLFSSNPGDVHAQIWGLIVFQSWWKRYM